MTAKELDLCKKQCDHHDCETLRAREYDVAG